MTVWCVILSLILGCAIGAILFGPTDVVAMAGVATSTLIVSYACSFIWRLSRHTNPIHACWRFTLDRLAEVSRALRGEPPLKKPDAPKKLWN